MISAELFIVSAGIMAGVSASIGYALGFWMGCRHERRYAKLAEDPPRRKPSHPRSAVQTRREYVRALRERERRLTPGA